MTMSDLPLRHNNRLSQRRLWFGTAAAAGAFAIDGFVCFLISTQACRFGDGRLGPLSPPAVRVLLGVITLICLAVAASGGLVSIRNYRAVSEPHSIFHAEALNREAFMSLVGILLSAAFVIGIIWAGIPVILIQVCVNAR